MINMLFIDTVTSVYNRCVLVSLSRLLKPDYRERLLVRSGTGQKPETIRHIAWQSCEDVLTQHIRHASCLTMSRTDLTNPFSLIGDRLPRLWLGRSCLCCRGALEKKGEMCPALAPRAGDAPKHPAPAGPPCSSPAWAARAKAPRLLKHSRNTVNFSRWELLLRKKLVKPYCP